jgi:hypothetical protein
LFVCYELFLDIFTLLKECSGQLVCTMLSTKFGAFQRLDSRNLNPVNNHGSVASGRATLACQRLLTWPARGLCSNRCISQGSHEIRKLRRALCDPQAHVFGYAVFSSGRGPLEGEGKT